MSMSVKLNGTTIASKRIAENSISISDDKNKQRSLSITLYATSLDGLPDVGEDIQVLEGTNIRFGGNIKDVKFVPITPSMSTDADIACQIYSDGYNGLPQRRTVNVLSTATTSGAVVTNLVNNFLDDEGVTLGTIDTGATIVTYGGNYKTIKEVLDDMADISGYEWNINNDKSLDFLSPTDIITSTDTVNYNDATHFNFRLSQTLSNYRNKQFVEGGLDSTGATVRVVVEDAAEIANRIAIEGGTGVYGNVFRDNNIQTTTDATAVANELLNRYKNIYVATFQSYVEYTVGTQIAVTYPKYGIAIDTEFIITKGTAVRDTHRWLYTYTIEQRDFSNFSNKAKENSVDFFGKLARPDKVVQGGGENTKRLESATINRSTGEIEYIPEGATVADTITFVETSTSITYTWSDSFTTTITIV